MGAAVIPPSQITIIVDSREQAPFTFAGMQTETAALPHGDYSVGGMEKWIAVERKSLSDFIACMTSQRRRFETELAALRGYRYRAVVVEYNLDTLLRGLADGSLSRMSWQSALGTISAWTGRFAPIMFCGSRKGGEAFARAFLTNAAKDILEPLQHLAQVQVQVQAREPAA